MVYESDFYTTRRPYSRPLASSYTVTSPLYYTTYLPYSYYHHGPIKDIDDRRLIDVIYIVQVRPVPYMPYLAHKRLVTIVHSPIHSVYHTGTSLPIRIHSRVRPSILAAEMNRIRDLPRSSSKSYTEMYLNSRDNIFFDDETREIRAKADSLLRRIHVYVPRPSTSDFAESIIPERLRSDDYIRRLLSARKNVKKELELLPWYTVPEKRHIGRGSLSCVQYVGGRPQSKRRPYFTVADLRPADIKNDVNLLSYYSKNRQAAANAYPVTPMTEREIRKARANETEWSEAIKKRESGAPPASELEPVDEVVAEEPEPVAEQQYTEPEKVEKKKKEKKHKEKQQDRLTAAEEEAMRKAEEFLARQVEEARLEEERRKAAEEERIRLEKEAEEARIAMEKAAEEARLAEIEEQKRLEAEREAARLAEEERLAAEAEAKALAAEEERQAAKRAAEEERKRQEEEERLAAEAAALAAEAKVVEEIEEHVEETQHQLEENVDPMADYETTKVEEENTCGGEEPEDVEEPFVEEPTDAEEAIGIESQPEAEAPVEEAPQVEEVTTPGEETIEEVYDEA